MPIRPYLCTNEDCDNYRVGVDALRGLTDDSPEPCPECKQPMMPTFPTSVGIAFKGSGFYSTDYT